MRACSESTFITGPIQERGSLFLQPLFNLLTRQCRAGAVAALLLPALNSGCASAPDCYSDIRSRDELRQDSQQVRYEYGSPNWFLDGLQQTAQLPSRILLGGRLKAETVSPEESRELLTDYMQQNGLTDVPVLVHRYDPVGQWKQLRENDLIAPGWKYTAGTASVAAYTLVPGRVLARDTYNPFTNTLSFNSGRVTDALHAAAYAKDIHRRDSPGTYAVANSIPGVALWKTTRAVNDIVAYAQARDSWSLERDIYRDQYPQVGVKTIGPAGFFMTPVANIALTISGSAVGYAVGRTVEQQRLAEREAASSKTELDEEAVAPHIPVKLAGHSKYIDQPGESSEETLDVE